MATFSTPSLRTAARIAGGSLILMAILAGIGLGYAFNGIYVPTDSAASLRHTQENPTLLPLFLATLSGVMLLDLVVSWAMYHFFFAVHPLISRISAGLRIAYTGALIAALFPIWQVLQLPSPTADTIQQSLQAFLAIWSWGLILFGGHLLLLGYLAVRAGFVPKWIAYLALFAGVCYLLTHSADRLLPGYALYKSTIEAILALPMTLGELLLAIWLVARGGKAQ